jgi:hypothetical protein
MWKVVLLIMALVAALGSAASAEDSGATDYRFFCTNHSDPAINPDHNGVFVAITYGTAENFDVVHSVGGQLYNRQKQYKVTGISHPGDNNYFWEGFMRADPHVVMTGHLWENEGVWIYTENQTFTDGRPPKLATPPVTCRNTVDTRQSRQEQQKANVLPDPKPKVPSSRMIGTWLVNSDRDRFSGEPTVIAMTMQNGSALALRCLKDGLSFAIHSDVISGKPGDLFQVKFKGGTHAPDDTIAEAFADSIIQVLVTPAMRPALVTSDEFAFRIIDGTGAWHDLVFDADMAPKAFADVLKACPSKTDSE